MNHNRRDALPVHAAPDAVSPAIRLCGLVEQPLTLGTSDLTQLPLVTIVDDFTCLEGWTVPALRWQGPLLATVVRLGVLNCDPRDYPF